MITCQEMKKLEKAADDAGLSYIQMMENAGMAAADFICDMSPVGGKNIVVICGPGNNGGDGFVVARVLSTRGASVSLMLPNGTPKSPDAVHNYKLCMQMGIPFVMPPEQPKPSPSPLGAFAVQAAALMPLSFAHILVDAIYGTGFHGHLSSEVFRLIQKANMSDAYKIALDVPSGLAGDNYHDNVGPHFYANATVTFHDEKPVHHNPMARTGHVFTAPIGIELLNLDMS